MIIKKMREQEETRKWDWYSQIIYFDYTVNSFLSKKHVKRFVREIPVLCSESCINQLKWCFVQNLKITCEKVYIKQVIKEQYEPQLGTSVPSHAFKIYGFVLCYIDWAWFSMLHLWLFVLGFLYFWPIATTPLLQAAPWNSNIFLMGEIK